MTSVLYRVDKFGSDGNSGTLNGYAKNMADTISYLVEYTNKTNTEPNKGPFDRVTAFEVNIHPSLLDALDFKNIKEMNTLWSLSDIVYEVYYY